MRTASTEFRLVQAVEARAAVVAAAGIAPAARHSALSLLEGRPVGRLRVGVAGSGGALIGEGACENRERRALDHIRHLWLRERTDGRQVGELLGREDDDVRSKTRSKSLLTAPLGTSGGAMWQSCSGFFSRELAAKQQTCATGVVCGGWRF